jgi:hypothetical protein
MRAAKPIAKIADECEAHAEKAAAEMLDHRRSGSLSRI